MVGVSKFMLGADVIAAIVKSKGQFRRGELREFDGKEFSDSVKGRRGAKYYEVDVGLARPGDPAGTRGKRRLVLLADSGRITEMYFSDSHYMTGSWRRIADFESVLH